MDAKHAGQSEAWITARARVKRGWTAVAKHGVLPRAYSRPVERESAGAARFARVLRRVALRPRYGAHGVAYARGM